MDGPNSKTLSKLSRDCGYYSSRNDIVRDPRVFAYQHVMLRAWTDLGLCGVLTLDGIPTAYLRDEKRPVTPSAAAELHREFWNQGVASVLVLRDPERIRVFSAMVAPIERGKENDATIDKRLVETVTLAAEALWQDRFYLQLATGAYYTGTHAEKFDPRETVDAYLLDNLQAVRNELVDSLGLEPVMAHSFLGRLLFTCYLCDRGIIKLADYFPRQKWSRIHDILADSRAENACSALYSDLFPALQREFNGSLFENDLERERDCIGPEHLEVIQRFLNGDPVRANQRSLGFWAYNFKFIPVETISAIYEKFLEKEDSKGKRVSGAFYTPRFLAEMTLDMALEGVRPLRGKRYLDPACGSGIFLVLLFNRLAAEWRSSLRRKPTAQEQADALLDLLRSLSGVDKHLTACRITCFSLYLAFLDQFDPPDVKSYKLATNKKLPNLLRRRGARRGPDLTVVWEADFFDVAERWKGEVDVVVGNPPWARSGGQRLEQQFMEAVPDLLDPDGRACLLLPSKVFLNKTDAFQDKWLRRVTLDKAVQLADYRFILFKEAKCPCIIARFAAQPPDIDVHEIEYVTPKVLRTDLRDGVITVASGDRKWIPLRLLLAATEQRTSAVVWKSRLWGTRRDLKLLDYLCTFPRLGERADLLSETRHKERKHPWAAGQGFKPIKKKSENEPDRKLKPLGDWSGEDAFITADILKGLMTPGRHLCTTLATHLESKGYLSDELYSKPPEDLFTPPLVVFNQGFSEFGFIDYPVRFQDALQSIAGPDPEALLFLTGFLRSKLARYFIFHTSANIATERDKAHLFEVLRLPFFLPNDKHSLPNASNVFRKVTSMVRKLKDESESSAKELSKRLARSKLGELFGDSDDEADSDTGTLTRWLQKEQNRTRTVQKKIEPLIYDYFGLNKEERALVEDTVEIFDQSDTPPSLEAAKHIPTLRPLTSGDDLAAYADCVTGALNHWATGPMRVTARGGVDTNLGLALIEVYQAKTTKPFETRLIEDELTTALIRLQELSTERSDSHVAYLRDTFVFDGTRLFIVKPAIQIHWTRTAALNDATAIHAEIAAARLEKMQA